MGTPTPEDLADRFIQACADRSNVELRYADGLPRADIMEPAQIAWWRKTLVDIFRPAVGPSPAVDFVASLTAEQRLEVIARSCPGCGVVNPPTGRGCQCWNDE